MPVIRGRSNADTDIRKIFQGERQVEQQPFIFSLQFFLCSTSRDKAVNEPTEMQTTSAYDGGRILVETLAGLPIAKMVNGEI